MSMRIQNNAAVARTQETSSQPNVPAPYGQFTDAIMQAAQKYNLPPEVLFGILKQESGGRVDITGYDGHGQGPWQIDDRYHADFLATSNNGRDIAKSTDYAAQLLRSNIDALGGDLAAGIAAYNAGVGGVQRAQRNGRSPDSATTGGNYSATILANAEEFKRYLGGAAGAPGTTPSSSTSAPGSTPSSSSSTPSTSAPTTTAAGDYTIKSGDTLSAIAGRLKGQGMQGSVQDIMQQILQANPQITNPNLIIAGNTMKLPGATSPAGDSFDGSTPSTSGRPDLNPGATPGTSSSAPVNSTAPAAAVTNSGPASADKIPFISQYSPAGAANGYTNGPSNCGPTSMAMIARGFGYGQGMTDAQLINHLGAKGGTSGDGTNVNGILAMAQAMGKQGEMKGPGADVNWIAEQLKSGKAVVANLDYYATAGHQNDGKTSGHYVTVAGMDADGNFIIRDPADQNIKTLTPAQLQYAINQNPNGGFQFAIG
ncbi:MAG TPA: C39 family peptidase [Myxococcaceae bacterium]